MQCWYKRTHHERTTRVTCDGRRASREQMCVRERRTNCTLPLLVQVMVSVKSWLIWVLSRSQHGWAHKQNATGSAGTSSVSGRNIPPLLHELIKPSIALFLSLWWLSFSVVCNALLWLQRMKMALHFLFWQSVYRALCFSRSAHSLSHQQCNIKVLIGPALPLVNNHNHHS